MSRLVPTVIGFLALITAAFTVGRHSKVSVADVSESTELDDTPTDMVTSFTPPEATKGTATAFTLVLKKAASASSDKIAFATNCATVTTWAAVTKKGDTGGTASFTVPTSETATTLNVCYKYDGEAQAQQTGKTLKVKAAASTSTASTSTMTVSSFGTSYSQATVGKTYAQIKAIDDIIRFNADASTADATVKSLKTFYTSNTDCNLNCRTVIDQAMSQMLSGTMRSR
jgi:hypothetical protein